MQLFKEVPTQATQRFGQGGMYGEMEEPNDEAVRAAITQFRQIYAHNEPHSFQKALKLLKRSAHDHDGPERAETIALLDGHLDAEREALNRGIGLGIVLERPTGSQSIDTRTIIDAYFHGHYLHSGNKKTELARQLDELQPWPKYTLYTVMLRLHNVYWVAANAVDRVLAVPEMLDSDELHLPLEP